MTNSYPMAMFMMSVYVDLHLHRVVGTILAGKTRSARGNFCLSATNFTWIGLAMNTGLRRKVPTTDHLSRDENTKMRNSNK
jgi:hypothetical protein